MLHDVRLAIAVDAAGDSTDSPAYWPGLCYLEEVRYVAGDLAANVDFTMSHTLQGITVAFLTITDLNPAVDTIWRPRTKGNDGADGSALADGDGNAYGRYIIGAKPSIVTADGGVSKSGTLYFILDVPSR